MHLVMSLRKRKASHPEGIPVSENLGTTSNRKLHNVSKCTLLLSIYKENLLQKDLWISRYYRNKNVFE